MKYKLLLVLLVLFPVLVSAECNQTKHKEYEEIAKNITYDNHFDRTTGKYTFTIYNITGEMYGIYNGSNIKPDNENKIEIKDILQGRNVSISIYANDGCDPIKYFGVTEAYFNKFYNTEECLGYENMKECSKEFTSSQITEEILKNAKKYYYANYSTEEDQSTGENETSIIDLRKEYISKWWVKVLLSIVTTVLCIYLYRIRLRKIKHGI